MKREFVLACLCALTFAAAAQEKIGFVDMDKVFNEYDKTKVAKSNWEKQREVFRKYADEMNQSLRKLQAEYVEIRDASQNIALSDVERENKRLSAQDKYRQMKEKEAEIKQYLLEKQDMVNKKYEEMRESLLKDIGAVVEKKAKEGGYAAVVDISGKTLNNLPPVVYFKKENDITQNVLESINAGQ